MRQPPENDAHGRACASASKPSPCRIAAARAGAEWAPMSTSRVSISARRSPSACSASARSAVRSVSAASTTSISGSGPPGASCATAPMRTPRGSDDAAALGRDLAPDDPEQGRLAGAVAADEPDPRPVRHREGGVIEEDPLADPVGQLVDVKHRAFCGAPCRDASRRPAGRPHASRQANLTVQAVAATIGSQRVFRGIEWRVSTRSPSSRMPASILRRSRRGAAGGASIPTRSWSISTMSRPTSISSSPATCAS